MLLRHGVDGLRCQPLLCTRAGTLRSYVPAQSWDSGHEMIDRVSEFQSARSLRLLEWRVGDCVQQSRVALSTPLRFPYPFAVSFSARSQPLQVCHPASSANVRLFFSQRAVRVVSDALITSMRRDIVVSFLLLSALRVTARLSRED